MSTDNESAYKVIRIKAFVTTDVEWIPSGYWISVIWCQSIHVRSGDGPFLIVSALAQKKKNCSLTIIKTFVRKENVRIDSYGKIVGVYVHRKTTSHYYRNTRMSSSWRVERTFVEGPLRAVFSNRSYRCNSVICRIVVEFLPPKNSIIRSCWSLSFNGTRPARVLRAV